MGRFIAPSVDERAVLIFTLTKTDEFGASDSGQVEITVNNAPSANAGADRPARPNARIVLDGRGSADTDGVITTYAWQQTSGPAVIEPAGFDTAQPSFAIPAAPSGILLGFRLKVTDDNGATASDATNISIGVLPPGPGPGDGDGVTLRSGV